MSVVKDGLHYTENHEWARVDGDIAYIGITDYAQGELGDIVFFELPDVGTEATANQAFGTVEAVKAVEDIFAPVSGEIVAVNDKLVKAPETVNKDPYGDGWIIQIKLSNPAELDGLLSADEYQKLIG